MWDAYRLAREAGLQVPVRNDSPGAQWLLMLSNEHVDRVLAGDGDDAAIQQRIGAVAQTCVPGNLWAVWADLLPTKLADALIADGVIDLSSIESVDDIAAATLIHVAGNLLTAFVATMEQQ